MFVGVGIIGDEKRPVDGGIGVGGDSNTVLRSCLLIHSGRLADSSKYTLFRSEETVARRIPIGGDGGSLFGE